MTLFAATVGRRKMNREDPAVERPEVQQRTGFLSLGKAMLDSETYQKSKILRNSKGVMYF